MSASKFLSLMEAPQVLPDGTIVVTGVQRLVPDSATPLLLQPESHVIQIGDAQASLNAMTGDWIVTGQKGENTPYIMSNAKQAACLALTIDHYNRTGEKKKFSKVRIVWKKEPKSARPGGQYASI